MALPDQSTAAAERLWRRVLGLRTWFYLARRTGTPKQTALKVIEHDGRLCVLIFTDELGSVQHQFAQHATGPGLFAPGGPLETRQNESSASGLSGAAGTPSAPSAPSAPDTADALGAWRNLDSVEMATELSHAQAAPLLERAAANGVTSALFDFDDEAFEVPLAALLPLQPRIEHAQVQGLAAVTRFRGPPVTHADFPRLLARAADSEEAASQALHALFALKDWWFICNPRDPDAIFVRRIEGRSVLMIFTGQRRAIAATEHLGVTSDEGTILLLQLAVEDSIEWLGAFVTEGVDQVAFDGIEGGLRLSIDALRERWDAWRASS